MKGAEYEQMLEMARMEVLNELMQDMGKSQGHRALEGMPKEESEEPSGDLEVSGMEMESDPRAGDGDGDLLDSELVGELESKGIEKDPEAEMDPESEDAKMSYSRKMRDY